MYTPAAAKNCVRPESAPLTIFIGIAFAFPSFGDVQWADDFHNLVDIRFSEIANLNWKLEISIGLRIEIHLFYINDTSVLVKKNYWTENSSCVVYISSMIIKVWYFQLS